MRKFRVSGKSSKSTDSTSQPLHASIPHKDATAILPPKKVIRALYDYEPENPATGLTFSAGDFLHVVARENDDSWYEACNPLLGTRGLVPANHFEIIGKTMRDSGVLGASRMSKGSATGSATHDSGFAEGNGITDGTSRQSRLSKSSIGKGAGAMVYGVVQYDFQAERPDELEAKAGEAIIVVAQSNPEWFVAKPISRLGGPGLIPVSFVQIRDMATGVPVPDSNEAVRRAGVPKVEEWKRMTAEYKNSGIPLGRLDSGSATTVPRGTNRLSVASSQRQPNGYQPRPSNDYQSSLQQQRTNSTYRAQSIRDSRASHLVQPYRVTVPRYCYGDERFWFAVQAEYADGKKFELSRYYENFYDLQVRLIEAFPHAAGNVKGVPRSLPFMPGPVHLASDAITAGRRPGLEEYLRKIIGETDSSPLLDSRIQCSPIVMQFFEPREGDIELDPIVPLEKFGDNIRRSAVEDQGYVSGHHTSVETLPPQPLLPSPKRHSSEVTASQYQSARHLQPPLHRQGSALTQDSKTSSIASSNPQQPSTTVPLKIKVKFPLDNTVFIRLSQAASFDDLQRRIWERWQTDTPDIDPEGKGLVVECKEDGKAGEEGWWMIEESDQWRKIVEASSNFGAKITLRVGLE